MAGRAHLVETIYNLLSGVDQYSLDVNLGVDSYQTFTYAEGTRRLAGMRVVNPAETDVTCTYDAVGNTLSIADTGWPTVGSTIASRPASPAAASVSGSRSRHGRCCAAGPGRCSSSSPAIPLACYRSR